MDLEFIQKPQDQRADTVLNVQLAPSYVTYNAATVQRIIDFFHTEEVMGAHIWGERLSHSGKVAGGLYSCSFSSNRMMKTKCHTATSILPMWGTIVWSSKSSH